MAINTKTPLSSKFDRLLVTAEAFRKDNSQWYVSCRCDCGEERIVLCKNLVSGHTKSCGCISKQRKREGNVTHGMSQSPEWFSYHAMLTRCNNRNSSNYHNYGGRGIRVCDRWASGFDEFYKDMGKRPNGCSLDRIDSNGNYEPENCRWATKLEQSNNKRNNSKLEVNGKTFSVSELSGNSGISRATLDQRLKNSWNIDRAITEKPFVGKNQSSNGGSGELVSFNGESKTWKEWSVVVGIKYTTLKKRIENGWTIERALSQKLEQHRKK